MHHLNHSVCALYDVPTDGLFGEVSHCLRSHKFIEILLYCLKKRRKRKKITLCFLQGQLSIALFFFSPSKCNGQPAGTPTARHFINWVTWSYYTMKKCFLKDIMTITKSIRTRLSTEIYIFCPNDTLEVCLCYCFFMLLFSSFSFRAASSACENCWACFFFVFFWDLPIQKSLQGLFLKAREQNFFSALLCSPLPSSNFCRSETTWSCCHGGRSTFPCSLQLRHVFCMNTVTQD